MIKLRKKDAINHIIEIARSVISDCEIPWEENHKVKNNILEMKWVSGGVSGGSCWDTSDPQPFSNDYTPKRFITLDKLLENICPTISFLVFKDLELSLVEEDSDYENEYYGNCTDYTVWKIDLLKLWIWLDEKGLIEYE